MINFLSVRSNPELSASENAYKIFKRCWINQHIDDITMTQTEALYENDESNNNLHECENTTKNMSFDEYVEEYGFANAELYPSYDEFFDNDFEDFLFIPKLEEAILDKNSDEVLQYICYSYRVSQFSGQVVIRFSEMYCDQDLFIDTLRRLGIKKFILNNSDPDIIDTFRRKGYSVTLDEYKVELWIRDFR